MRWPRKIWLRVRSLVRRGAVDGELDEELRFHLERQIVENMAAGMSRKEASYAALREFGGVEQYREECREMRRVNWPQDFVQDVRYGVRVLLKNKGFAAIAVLTLALGIGANTAIFSLIDAIMLRTLPVRDPQQLMILQWTALHNAKTQVSYNWGGCPGDLDAATVQTPGDCGFSYPMFEQIRNRQTVMSATAAFVGLSQFHVASGGEVTLASGYLVSGDFFTTLGTRAALGRVLDAADDRANAPGVAVLGYLYWQSRFGRDPSVAGKSILIENQPFTIVGVAAPSFNGIDPGLATDIWLPMAAQLRVNPYLPKQDSATDTYLDILGRLKPGVTARQAKSELSAIYATGSTTGAKPIFQASDAPRIELWSIAHGLTSLRGQYWQPLRVLMAAVGIILLIACANVGGLSLARATSRRPEIAMRFTLGASRGRIVRQLLTESMMVSVAGAALGILLAYWSADGVTGFLSANSFFTMDLNVAPNPRILAFTTAIAVVTGLLFGLAPALEGLRVDMAPALRGATSKKRTLFSERRLGAGSLLVVGQVALSVVVLAGAGLLVHTLVRLRSTNIGFRADNVLIFRVDMSMLGYKLFDDPRTVPLDRELQTRMSSLPGVAAASYSGVALLSGSNMTNSYLLPEAANKTPLEANELSIGRGFFETMQIPLLSGRTFTDADFATTAKPEPVVINESFSRKLFGEANPLGRTLMEGGAVVGQFQVIGVVRDAKYHSLRDELAATVYTIQRTSGANFELRTSGNPKALISLVRDAVKQVNANLLVSHIKTQNEQIEELLYQERLVAGLSALFGALALLLASIGLYGLLSYEVARRTREIGIRLALGAPQRVVLRLVMRRGFALALEGAVIGIAVAAGITRYLQTLLYGVRPTDPYTFVAAIFLLAIVAALACYVPARRAMRVDPMVALRYE